MNVHELAAQMTADRFREEMDRDRELQRKIDERLNIEANKRHITIDQLRAQLPNMCKENLAKTSPALPIPSYKDRLSKPSKPNQINLDYLDTPEVEDELARPADQAGYGGNVSLFLANNGEYKKTVPDPKKSLGRLEANHGKDHDGVVKRIDPHFRLFHDMMEDK